MKMEEAQRIAKLWGFTLDIEYMMMGAVLACITYSPVRAAWYETISNPGVYQSEEMAAMHLIQNMSNHIYNVVKSIGRE